MPKKETADVRKRRRARPAPADNLAASTADAQTPSRSNEPPAIPPGVQKGAARIDGVAGTDPADKAAAVPNGALLSGAAPSFFEPEFGRLEARTGASGGWNEVSVAPAPESASEVKYGAAVEVLKQVENAPAPTGADAVKVTNSNRARLYAALGALLPAVLFVKGWVEGGHSEVRVAIVCVVALAVALIFRNLIIEVVRMHIAADPEKLNVR